MCGWAIVFLFWETNRGGGLDGVRGGPGIDRGRDMGDGVEGGLAGRCRAFDLEKQIGFGTERRREAADRAAPFLSIISPPE